MAAGLPIGNCGFRIDLGERSTHGNDRAFGGSSVLGDIVQQPFYIGNILLRALHASLLPPVPILILIHTVVAFLVTSALVLRISAVDSAAPRAVVLFLFLFLFFRSLFDGFGRLGVFVQAARSDRLRRGHDTCI